MLKPPKPEQYVVFGDRTYFVISPNRLDVFFAKPKGHWGNWPNCFFIFAWGGLSLLFIRDGRGIFILTYFNYVIGAIVGPWPHPGTS